MIVDPHTSGFVQTACSNQNAVREHGFMHAQSTSAYGTKAALRESR
jgi:hypothetical protein